MRRSTWLCLLVLLRVPEALREWQASSWPLGGAIGSWVSLKEVLGRNSLPGVPGTTATSPSPCRPAGLQRQGVWALGMGLRVRPTCSWRLHERPSSKWVSSSVMGDDCKSLLGHHGDPRTSSMVVSLLPRGPEQASVSPVCRRSLPPVSASPLGGTAGSAPRDLGLHLASPFPSLVLCWLRPALGDSECRGKIRTWRSDQPWV